jgi:hypothetical protein
MTPLLSRLLLLPLLLARGLDSAAPSEKSGWEAGQWVTYHLRAGPNRSHFLRIALVGTPKVGGGEQWLELELSTHPEFQSPLTQIRVAVAPGASLAQPTIELGKLIVSVGLSTEVELQPKEYLSSEKAERGSTASGWDHRESFGEVRTHAGVLYARQQVWSFRGKSRKKLWTSRQVPFWGVARWELPDLGRSLEVWKFGRGAIARSRELNPKLNGTPEQGAVPQ